MLLFAPLAKPGNIHEPWIRAAHPIQTVVLRSQAGFPGSQVPSLASQTHPPVSDYFAGPSLPNSCLEQFITRGPLRCRLRHSRFFGSRLCHVLLVRPQTVAYRRTVYWTWTMRTPRDFRLDCLTIPFKKGVSNSSLLALVFAMVSCIASRSPESQASSEQPPGRPSDSSELSSTADPFTPTPVNSGELSETSDSATPTATLPRDLSEYDVRICDKTDESDVSEAEVVSLKSSEFRPPEPIEVFSPVYPPLASEDRIEGTVITKFVVSTLGRAVKIESVRGPAELRQTCAEAVRCSTWTPATRNGDPVAVNRVQKCTFRLEN